MLASKQAFTTTRRTLPITSPALGTDLTPRIRVVIGKLSRRLRPTSAGIAAGLTPTKVSVLFTIARVGPIRLSELAEAEGLNPTMLSRVVAGFTEAGLVTRSSDPVDRRSALVEIAPAGSSLCERMRRERTDALNVALSALSERDRRSLEQVLPVLEALAEQLKERRP
jgi:DNA-binding MarR family transcriptional regulator